MSRKPWSGRFREATHPLVEAYTSSIAQDARLAQWDLIGSIAHARMLERASLVSPGEARRLVLGLKGLYREARAGNLKLEPALEDIHMNIETILARRVGRPARKLHTARSRNDQVALDSRLAAREGLVQLLAELIALEQTVVSLARTYEAVPMLGRTHLQPAQALLLSHHLLAYREKLSRDAHRVAAALERADVSPLGAGALAGTSLPTDPAYTARLLGFATHAPNSLDAVSDRDYIADAAFASTMVLLHLSQLSEEIVLWSTEAFGYIELPDAFSTGSSLMPQKRNPDVAELTRGRAAIAIGDLAGLLALVKGLPLAYNRDLQEDKSALFRTLDLSIGAARVFSEMLPRLKFSKERLRAGFEEGFAAATELAESLVRAGVPFREAHETVGRIVRECQESGRFLQDLSRFELLAYSSKFDPAVQKTLTLQESAKAKRSAGGSSVAGVRRQIERARGDLAWQRRVHAKYKAKVGCARKLAD